MGKEDEPIVTRREVLFAAGGAVVGFTVGGILREPKTEQPGVYADLSPSTLSVRANIISTKGFQSDAQIEERVRRMTEGFVTVLYGALSQNEPEKTMRDLGVIIEFNQAALEVIMMKDKL